MWTFIRWVSYKKWDLLPKRENGCVSLEELEDFVNLFKKREITDNSWFVKVEDIKDYDLSAKNPNKNTEVEYDDPRVIMEKIKETNKKIEKSINNLNCLI